MSAREQHKLHEVPAALTAEAPHRRTKAEELAALLEAHRGERPGRRAKTARARRRERAKIIQGVRAA